MACPRYVSPLQELVDGTIGSIRRSELESHLDLCEECRALLADLEQIRDGAAALDDRQPPNRVWLQIAGRLRQEGRIRDTAPPLRQGRGSWRVLALAATLVLAVGASMFFLLPAPRQQQTAPGPGKAPVTTPGTAADAAAVESVESELQQAEQHYETAIARLQQIAGASQKGMDPQVAATLQKNVQVIDQAIAESRAALRTEPANAPARDSLFEALKQKVSLLQDTIALMNEMRKGNDAGAAHIVQGLNKS